MLRCPPLRERVYKGSASPTASSSITACVYSSTDRGVYKQWLEWRMEKAMEAISQGKVSMRRAALQFNIPKIHPRGQG